MVVDDSAGDSTVLGVHSRDEIEEESLPNRKRRIKKSTDTISVDEIEYKPIEFDDDDDYQLRLNMIKDPLVGYFYYCDLSGQLVSIMNYFMKKTKTQFAKNIHRIKFKTWETFKDEYRFTPMDRQVWTNIGPGLNIVEVSKTAVQYRRMLIDLLNHIYFGAIRGERWMDNALAERLVSFAKKYSIASSQDVSLQYFNLLTKEFNEFFDLDSAFGETFDLHIKHEPIYVNNDSFANDESEFKSSLKWTSQEKDIFYEALARYGISRADDISALLPEKSTIDVVNLYNLLSKELKRYKSDEQLKDKLISLEEMPMAYEMSEKYIEMEDQFAQSIEILDDQQFAMTPEFEKSYNYKTVKKEIKKFFNMEHIQDMLPILNDINKTNKAYNGIDSTKMNEQITIDLYNLVYDYIRELIQQLLINKINGFTDTQELSWFGLKKHFKPVKDINSMIHIFDSNNLDIQYVKTKEDIVRIDKDYGDDKDDDDDDYDNYNYLPVLIMKEEKMLDYMHPRHVSVPDACNPYGLVITEEDMEKAIAEFCKDYKGSKRLYDFFSGKKLYKRRQFVKAFGDIYDDKEVNDEKEDDEEDDEEYQEDEVVELETVNNDVPKNVEEDDDDETTEYSSENDDGDEEDDADDDDENIEYFTQIIENAENIDDLESDSEDENNDLFDQLNEYNTYHERIWFDEPFIVPDEKINEKYERVDRKNIDLTTKGHEYLQALIDDEEQRINKNDYQKSIKYENLYLSLLASKSEDNYTNDKIYADVISQFKYGGPIIDDDSWKSSSGGPLPYFADDDVKKNVHDSVFNIDRILDTGIDIGVNDEDVENFKHVYNDY